MERKLTKTER